MKSVLVHSNDKHVSRLIRSGLSPGCLFKRVSGFQSALDLMGKRRFDIVFFDTTDLNGSAETADFEDALHSLKNDLPSIFIVVLAPANHPQVAVRLLKTGVATTYQTHPISSAEIRLLVQNIDQASLQLSEIEYLRDQFWKSDAFGIVKTQNPAMRVIFNKIKAVAPTKASVLLVGETGTGKSLLAKLIHRHSNRSEAQFISVHCGAIPDTLIESELFGHEKGAFTGAIRKKLGKFEIARGGTIFLDEIGTITPTTQIKLLHVLQEGMFSRIGSEHNISSDARIIAATNSDLNQLVTEGTFRKDLYYRLNVFPIEVPPLKERREDIHALAELFLSKLNAEFSKGIQSIHADVIQALNNYDWPGNIRELENLMERAYILETTEILTPEGFPVELFENEFGATVFTADASLPLAEARRLVIGDFERQYLKALLKRHLGRIKPSADTAGITTRQLHKLMSRYGIKKEGFKIR